MNVIGQVMIRRRGQFLGEGVDPASLTLDHIKLAFWLRLPFRLRLGTIRQIRLSDEHSLWVRNRVDLPQGTTIPSSLFPGRSLRDLNSEVIIISHHPSEMPGDILTHAAAAIEEDGPKSMPTEWITTDYWLALQAFNAFMVAYNMCTNELVSGGPLHTLTDSEFFDLMWYEAILITDPAAEITDDDVRSVFDAELGTMMTMGQTFFGTADDLPADNLVRICEALQSHQQYMFYEYTFDAKSRMARRDIVGALLYMVIAFEGAHNALAMIGFNRLLADMDDDKRPGTINMLLREQGISTIHKIVPYLFMEKENRPTVAEIEACQHGIELRNAIMHAKRDKTGYKIRQTSNEKISKAYGAVHTVYARYVAEIERRELLAGSDE